MKALVINLAKATERKHFQVQQLKLLNLEFEIIKAVEASEAPDQRQASFWRTGQVPLSNSEKACFLSHHRCWEQVAISDQPMLILEDDALLSDKVPIFFKSLPNDLHMDILNLETRARNILMGPPLSNSLHMRPLYLNRDGAAAYILWPSGAQKLLTQARNKVSIADAAIWSNFKLKAFQAHPALALQSDITDNYALPAYLKTQTSIVRIEKKSERRYNSSWEYLAFRLRRILGQLHLAKPQIRHLLSVRKERLPIDKDNFTYLSQINPQD